MISSTKRKTVVMVVLMVPSFSQATLTGKEIVVVAGTIGIVGAKMKHYHHEHYTSDGIKNKITKGNPLVQKIYEQIEKTQNVKENENQKNENQIIDEDQILQGLNELVNKQKNNGSITPLPEAIAKCQSCIKSIKLYKSRLSFISPEDKQVLEKVRGKISEGIEILRKMPDYGTEKTHYDNDRDRQLKEDENSFLRRVLALLQPLLLVALQTFLAKYQC